jgi:hypothetical protein
MFSVLKDLSLYADDAEMNVLEQALKQAGKGPFGQEKVQVNSLWEGLLDTGY